MLDISSIISDIFKGLVAIYSVLLFPLLLKYCESQILQYQQQKQKDQESKIQINLKYLSPLRLYLKESYIRLYKINKASLESKNRQALTLIDTPVELMNKPMSWMINDGYYIMSSCYIIACLFFAIKQVRDATCYISLGKNEDTELLRYMDEINLAFAKNGGVHFMIQFSLANDIYLRDQQRLMTYREFCEMLKSSEQTDWWHGLINFFIQVGYGEKVKLDHLQKAIDAIKSLSNFLDDNIGTGDSIKNLKYD